MFMLQPQYTSNLQPQYTSNLQPQYTSNLNHNTQVTSRM